MYPVQCANITRMPKSLSKVSKTTTRGDLLNIMGDSYLFENKRAARYALGATCAAVRAWMIAMTEDPPKEVTSRLVLPAVGAIRIGWYEYRDGQRRLRLRFTPTHRVRELIRAHNRAEAGTVPGTEK